MSKTRLMIRAAVACGLMCAQGLSAAVRSEGASAEGKPLKVLMIGNSFSLSCLGQTPQIAAAYSCKLDLASLSIGGASLEVHCRNIARSKAEPEFKPYRLDRICEGRRVAEKTSANIPGMLSAEPWDVVTIQQCSPSSWDEQSYRPLGDNLVKAIRELAPGAEIVVQETWSYPPWDKRLKGFGFDQVDMYVRLHNAYRQFAGAHGLRLIPTGTAAEFCPDRNRLFTKPDFHFNRLEGEYLQGLVWAGALFGRDKIAAEPCRHLPQGLARERAEVLRQSALDALDGERAPSGGACAIRRAFRDYRVTRGNTNVARLQPIDAASWIWLAGDSGVLPPDTPENWLTNLRFVKFKKVFTVEEDDGALVLDVSADERFYLMLDGAFVARGPNRSTVENWQYQTYVIDHLRPGEHTLEAVVWIAGTHGPLAQLTNRGGFICKASGAYDGKLTTGVAEWQAGRLDAVRSIGAGNGVWGTGAAFEITGRGPYAGEPAAYAKAEVVRGPAGTVGPEIWGSRTKGWMLFPSQLPDQIERRANPFVVKAIAENLKWRAPDHVYSTADTQSPLIAELNELIAAGKPCTIPANRKIQAVVDCLRYTCAYPEVTMKGGKGARLSWTWAEAPRYVPGPAHKYADKGNRGEFLGKYLDGYGDIFVCDGGEGRFSTPWFRCGRWCRLDIETGSEPLVLTHLGYIESRYPLEQESDFSSAQDPSFADIRRICTRAMQMCDHEMLFDCPYYEQQMYPGDTRVQLNVLSALSQDDRMIKRAIEIYDLNTRDDGMCPMNFPTRGLQESLSYTLCYLLMYGDYTMNHNDVQWLKARIPGLRKSMAGVEYYENAEGLIANPPGWSFMDWTVGWSGHGVVPGTYEDEGITSELNLFWLLAMQSASVTERALGHELQARYWEQKAAKLKTAIIENFWCEERSLFADNRRKNTFSEHAQCLAILADVLNAEKTERLFAHLIGDKDLKRTTVYFSYYLFDAFLKMGRGDLFIARLDLWRGYVKKGVTTLLEMPETDELQSRSDCHAWGAHPLWFMQTGLAGIKSAAPFFARVKVAPSPGALKDVKARHPHPDGWIEVDLHFEGGKATGRIATPVPGEFVFGSQRVKLNPGENVL